MPRYHLLDLEDVTSGDGDGGFDHISGKRSIRREYIIRRNSGGESNSYQSKPSVGILVTAKIQSKVGATDPPQSHQIHQRQMELEDHDKGRTFGNLLALVDPLSLLFQQPIALLAQTQHRCTVDRQLHDRLENSVCDSRSILVF